jgi:hypothetical protein
MCITLPILRPADRVFDPLRRFNVVAMALRTVDPLRQLGETHRVLKPGDVLLVFLPDRRFTFDRKRSPTPLAHLIEDHREQATVASDEHVEDYLRKTDVWDPSWNAQDLHEQFELNRRRSIHVHCWSEDEFLPVLEHSILEMRMRWELLDAAFIADASDGFEFGFVLRRAAGDATPTRLSSISASPGRRLRRKHGSARTPIGRWRVCAQCQAFRSRSAPGGCSAASATPSPSADDRERLQRAPVCAHPHKSGPGR